jgi:hypothetical protein
MNKILAMFVIAVSVTAGSADAWAMGGGGGMGGGMGPGWGIDYGQSSVQQPAKPAHVTKPAKPKHPHHVAH